MPGLNAMDVHIFPKTRADFLNLIQSLHIRLFLSEFINHLAHATLKGIMQKPTFIQQTYRDDTITLKFIRRKDAHIQALYQITVSPKSADNPTVHADFASNPHLASSF
jgi:hypothetical protein